MVKAGFKSGMRIYVHVKYYITSYETPLQNRNENWLRWEKARQEAEMDLQLHDRKGQLLNTKANMIVPHPEQCFTIYTIYPLYIYTCHLYPFPLNISIFHLSTFRSPANTAFILPTPLRYRSTYPDKSRYRTNRTQQPQTQCHRSPARLLHHKTCPNRSNQRASSKEHVEL